MPANGRPLLLSLFDAAVGAVAPAGCLTPHVPPPPRGRSLVIGAGKAAASMAQALEAGWLGELSGMVVTRYGHRVPTARIEVVEAAHPVPDAAGRAATERMLNLVQGLSSDGTKDNAGAPLLPDTLARARANGLHAPACPANNDGYSFFAALDDLVVTGPTMTNVNDFRALLIR